MYFLYPEFIYMMLPVLLILFSLFLTQADRQEQIFSPDVLKKLRVNSDQFSNKTRNIFYFLMFFFIILALANPVIEKGSANVAIANDTFFIALDISKESDLKKEKVLLREMLKGSDISKIGLLGFAQESYLLVPPTRDRKHLVQAMEELEPLDARKDEESIKRVLIAANKLFEDDKELIIIANNVQDFKLKESADIIRKNHIKVSALSLASTCETLNTMVQESGGELIKESSGYFAKRFSKAKEGKEKPIYFYLFIMPIALAMVMLLIALSSFSRGEKYHLPLFLLLTFTLFKVEVLEADLLSFQTLDKANTLYKTASYGECAQRYKAYALQYDSPEALYNAANCYYLKGDYAVAISFYKSIHFVKGRKNYMLNHNLGNAYLHVKSGVSLRAAIKAYQKALSFYEGSETRENLEAAIKLLQLENQGRIASTKREKVTKKWFQNLKDVPIKERKSRTSDEKYPLYLFKIE